MVTAVRLSPDVIVHIPECWDVFMFQGIRFERIRGEWYRKG